MKFIFEFYVAWHRFMLKTDGSAPRNIFFSAYVFETTHV